MGRQITLFNWARLYGTLPPEARYCALFVYLFIFFIFFVIFFVCAFWGSRGFLWLPGTCCLFFVCFRFSLYRYCRHEDNSQVLFFITGLPPFIRTLLAFFLCDVIAMETSMQLPLVLVFFPPNRCHQGSQPFIHIRIYYPSPSSFARSGRL